VVISYSDGEGKYGQVGVAIWTQGNPIARAGAVRVPPSIRLSWDRKQTRNRHNDIFEVEAVGPLVILHNFADELKDSLWMHFVDNAAALLSLVRGSSSVENGDFITGATWSRIVELGCFTWFDQVDSASIPTHGVSTGRFDGPWILEPISFPSAAVPDASSM